MNTLNVKKRLPKTEDSAVIKLEDDLYDRGQQIALFKVVANAVREQFDLEAMFQMMATFAQDLIKAETVLIPVPDQDCAHDTYRAGCGRHAEEIIGKSLDINLGICGWAGRAKCNGLRASPRRWKSSPFLRVSS